MMKIVRIWGFMMITILAVNAQQTVTNDIYNAIRQKDFKKVSSMIQQNPLLVNEKDANGQTPLSIAVTLKDFRITEYLLKMGALANSGDQHLRAPIHFANFNTDTAMINLLLDYGAVIDTRAIGAATQNPGAPFNPAKAMHISASKTGTIYTTDISGGPGTEAIGVLKLNNGEYTTLERLGAPINTGYQNSHPFVDPDEDYLIYGSVIPTDSITKVLMISFKQDNVWGEPNKINLGVAAGQPYIMPDKKYLFFTSGEPGKSDIWWVSAKIIEELRPKE